MCVNVSWLMKLDNSVGPGGIWSKERKLAVFLVWAAFVQSLVYDGCNGKSVVCQQPVFG